ncbi:MAG: lamin tail domain-containing protein, partial [Gammaproteobacteria bacterium]
SKTGRAGLLEQSVMKPSAQNVAMTDSQQGLRVFLEALRAFRMDERPLAQLLDEIDRIIGGHQAAQIDLLAALIQEDASHPLPTEAFEAIERHLSINNRREDLEEGEPKPDGSIVEYEGSAASANSSQLDCGGDARARKPGYALPKIAAVAGLAAIGIAIVGYSTFDKREARGEDPAQSAVSSAADTSEEPLAAGAESGEAPQETNVLQSAIVQADADRGAATDPAPRLSSEAWEQAQSQLQSVQQEQALLVARLEAQRAETDALRSELELARGRLAERRTEFKDTQQALQLDRQQASEARDAEMARLEAKVTQLQSEVEERKRETEALDRENQQQRTALLASLDGLHRNEQQLQQTLDDRRSELAAAETELQQTQAELDQRLANEDRSASEIGSLETRVRRLQASIAAERRQTTVLEQRRQEERRALLGKLEELEGREKQLWQTLETRNKQFESVQAELAYVKQRHSRLQIEEERLRAESALAAQEAEQPLESNEPLLGDQRVVELLALAAHQFDVKRLTLPVGDNAHETYQKVLQLAPEQEEAQSGIGRIKEQYKVWADSAVQKSDWGRGRKYLEAALAIDPGDNELKSTLQKLNKAQSAAAQRAAQRRQAVRLAALLETATGQLDAQRLVEPPGDNAWETFNSVMEVDANNPRAREGLQTIAARLGSTATIKQREGKLEESLAITEHGLRVAPDHPQLQQLRAALRSQLKAQQTVKPRAGVVINEFMAANSQTIYDPQGDYDDWIELRNTTADAIDLSGYYLTDSPREPKQWRIPDGTIMPARGYLIIWADGDASYTNVSTAAYELHANFDLNRRGEQILLIDTDENGNAVIDSVSFDRQRPDISHARVSGRESAFRSENRPTPGRTN